MQPELSDMSDDLEDWVIEAIEDEPANHWSAAIITLVKGISPLVTNY